MRIGEVSPKATRICRLLQRSLRCDAITAIHEKIYDGSIPSIRGGGTLTFPQGAATTKVRGRDVMVICRTSGAAVENLLFLWLQARRRKLQNVRAFSFVTSPPACRLSASEAFFPHAEGCTSELTDATRRLFVPLLSCISQECPQAANRGITVGDNKQFKHGRSY